MGIALGGNPLLDVTYHWNPGGSFFEDEDGRGTSFTNRHLILEHKDLHELHALSAVWALGASSAKKQVVFISPCLDEDQVEEICDDTSDLLSELEGSVDPGQDLLIVMDDIGGLDRIMPDGFVDDVLRAVVDHAASSRIHVLLSTTSIMDVLRKDHPELCSALSHDALFITGRTKGTMNDEMLNAINGSRTYRITNPMSTVDEEEDMPLPNKTNMNEPVPNKNDSFGTELRPDRNTQLKNDDEFWAEQGAVLKEPESEDGASEEAHDEDDWKYEFHDENKPLIIAGGVAVTAIVSLTAAASALLAVRLIQSWKDRH